MKYIVYLTINTINRHIYVGVHATEDPKVFCGYIGCGVNIYKPHTYKNPKTSFQYAVKKYGVKAFERITLAVYDTKEDAFALENQIVTKEFIKRPDVYNMTVGGGIPPENSIEIHQYSLEGDYIKTWYNAQEAAKYFNTNNNVIRNAVNFKTTSYGYLWSEEYCNKLDISKYTVYDAGGIVYKFDLKGNLVEQYESLKDALEKNNIDASSVCYAIAGKTKCIGHYFSYDKNFKIDPDTYKKIDKVYLYDLDGSFFKEFESPIECARYFGKNHSSAVYRAIRTGRLYSGYQASKEKVECMKSMIKTGTPRKIAQYDLDGNFIKEYNSIQEACDIYSSSVKRVLKGIQKQTHGYIFKYVE